MTTESLQSSMDGGYLGSGPKTIGLAEVIRIEVTSGDIENGKRHDAQFCPIARAITREIGGQITVDDSIAVKSEYNITVAEYLLPKIARDFVRDFDAGCLVGPIQFELEQKNGI